MSREIDASVAKEILANVDNFLFDCDGVLWDGKGLIPGSLETIQKLKSLGKNVFYVTNNSSKTRDAYLAKCENYGFPAKKEEIVCTAYIAAQYLKSLNFKDKVYLIGTDDALGKELSDAGIQYEGPGPDHIVGELDNWFQTPLNPEVKCVVVGFDPHLSYVKILKAASYLRNPDCLFVGTNEDSTLPTKGQIVIPGTGCMVLPVTLAAGRQPTIMGKPEVNMFEVLRKIYNLDPKRCMMTGDRINTDIVFAKNCGIRSLLVLSGISTESDAKTVDAAHRPDYFAINLAKLNEFI